jgi:hypothetical protein
MKTEKRTFVGESATDKFDGWAGFRIGVPVELEVVDEDESHVRVRPAGATWAGSVMSLTEYKKWFK